MSRTHSWKAKDGVPVRISRRVTALIATGTAAAIIGLTAGPALADQNRQSEWWLQKDGIDTAWVTTQGAGVTIAVLSDGVDASHRDLAGSVTAAPAPAGAPVATGQFLGEQGTAIASLAAGHGHGARGLAGILGSAPAAKVLSVPVMLPPDDPQLSQQGVAAAIPDAIAAGIRYAVQRGASVIDLPIDPGQPGISGTGGAAAAAGGSSAEASAVSYAVAHNVVLVAPAGDDGTSSKAPNYPAAYPHVIAVGAFNSGLDKAPWSSHLGYVTLTGPGVGIRAAANSGGYETISSTVAASAVAAGAAALIRSRYPGLTAAQVTQALISSTLFHRSKPSADGSGYGVLDADQALAAAAGMAVPGSDKAGAGAQPLMAPSAQSAAATQSLGSQLLRDGLLAAGLLVVLLLLVGVYALVTRRRQPTRRQSAQRPQVTAEWAHRQAPSRYPQATSSDADAMLQYFMTPVAEPSQRGSQPARMGLQPGPGLFAPPSAGRAVRSGERGSVPAIGGASPGMASAGTAGADGAAANGAGRPAAAQPTGDSDSFVTPGPVSRPVSRRPPVSGTPPWDPAQPPDTELPWNTAPQRAIPAETASEPEWPGPAGQSPGPGRPAEPGWPAEPNWPTDSDWRTESDWPGGSTGSDRSRAPDWADEQPGPGSAIPPGSRAWQEDGAGRLSGANALFRRTSRAAEMPGPAQDGPARDTGWSQPGGPAAAGPDWRSPAGSPPGSPGQTASDRGRDSAARLSWDSPASAGAWSSPAEPAPAPEPMVPGPRADWQDAPAPQPPLPGRRARQAADMESTQDHWDDQPRTSKAGLPIRTPKHTATGPASPSGSLWEPAEKSPVPGDTDGQESGGRPIYVWRPAHQDDSYSGPVDG
jgi:hypothetical protein